MGISLISSCAKEDNMFTDDGNAGANGIVELSDLAPRTTSTAYASITKSFEALEEVNVPVNINYTGVNGAPQDVTLELGLNDAAVTATNTSYTILPTSLYTIPSTSVTIPKGQKKGTFIIKVKASSFDFSKTYALGVQIKSTSAGIISGNYGTGVFVITAKNQWDGIYSVEVGSYVQRYSNPTTPTVNDALNGSLAGNPNVTLSTVGASTLQIGNMRWAGGGSTVAGIDNTRVTINPSTNLTTTFSLGNTTLANRASLTNSYNPTTKTFTLNFDWAQTAAKREMTLILKYVGPRP